jgi:hypothetical protein
MLGTDDGDDKRQSRLLRRSYVRGMEERQSNAKRRPRD